MNHFKVIVALGGIAVATFAANLSAQTTTFPQRAPDAQYPNQQYSPPSYPSPAYPTQSAPYPTQPSSFPSQLPSYPPQYPSQPYELPAAPGLPFTPTTPTPSAQAGCSVELNADRSTIALLDRVSRQELRHVALGQDRVQKIYTAPDTTWSVALAKVRGSERFYFIAIDLTQCEAQDAVVVGGRAEEATFAGAEVVLKVGGNEQRFALRNK